MFENNILSGSFNNGVDFTFVIRYDVMSEQYDINMFEASRQEIIEQREREAQEIVTSFEHHLDAMRQIFEANTESAE